MAGLTSALCTTFKTQILTGTHNLDVGGNTIMCALFKANASIVGTYDAASTNYSEMTADEHANGSGYTTGGETVTKNGVSASGTTAMVDFADVTWSAATITANGAMLYNSSATNKAIAIIAFGSDKTSTSGDFSLIWPNLSESTAIIRIA